MVKAYIYTRVSSLQQSDGFGIPRQIHTLMDFLENAELPKELGYQLDPNDYEVLEHDAGLSGYSGHNFLKGSIGKFKKRVASGEITSGCLLIESVDRFSRKQGYDSIDEFTFLIKRNIDIIEVETGQIFSYKLDHKLTQLSTSIERAYQESKRKSRMAVKSWANVKRKAVEEGIAISRNVPYWLEVKNNEYLIRPEHTNKIKRVFDIIKASQKEIAKGFEQQKTDLANIAKANKKQQTNIITNNKEVYSKECIDEAGLEQLKKYKKDSK